MKKIINAPDQFAVQTVEGIIAAYGDRVKLLGGDPQMYLSNYEAPEGKVGIVTAGGSGHLPVFLGYVGQGMLDGCVVGNVFASPSAQKMADVIKACDRGTGVVCLYGNYGGDRLNFDMACEMVEMDDVETRTVLVADDICSSPEAQKDKRRGVAGMVYAFKVAGAAAERLMSLDEVADVASRALSNIRTMGVALTPCIVPMVGKPTFSIADDEIEVGMGIHGEAGIEVRKMMTADEIADAIMEKLFTELHLEAGDEVSIMVNGLGATPLEEQLIVYRRIHQILSAKLVSVFMPHIGEFATSMEMAGLSVTMFKLDAQMKDLLRAPANTPFYTNANK
ncbi:MAG: dihydroxyacetone kinase subunit DhaK [Christensenellaceae bacterium]|nr:dihydroxyacetone kinase subunit DhaK [Christensenellaceae bacterium]